jgi:AraC family transcriptional regulator of adaptative response / DNA-3-methyladenine glycosylase II
VTTAERLLPARAPFAFAPALAHFAARAVPGVEEVTSGGELRRAIALAHGPAVVGLSEADGGARLRLWGDARDLDEAAQRCATFLDLGADPATVRERLGGDPLIGALVRDEPGRRVPGALDGPELAIRVVINQQVSLAGAATVAGRLARELGAPLPEPFGGVTHAFPAPAALAAAGPEALPMPRSRGRAIVSVAAAVASGVLDLRPGADPDAAEAALLALPGIGPWTVSVVRLRALGDRDAFPAADLGLRRGLERLGADGRPRAALALAERWRPLRAYAAQYVWAAGTQ